MKLFEFSFCYSSILSKNDLNKVINYNSIIDCVIGSEII